MLNTKDSILNMINSPVRQIKGRVELYEGSTLLDIFNYTDALKSFTVDRVGEESKFFGFGVCQKLNIKLIDKERAINITTANRFEALYGVGSDYIYPYPSFNVTEVHRDENTNELSITAYDALYNTDKYTVADLGLLMTNKYTIKEFATACAALLGLPLKIENVTDDIFNLAFSNGANFDGTENIRQALNAVAEATQTIYYVNSNWELTFKRLSIDAESVLTIDKAKYITLDSKTNRRLSTITHATELGDNVTASIDESGSTQFIRDNPFLELRDDIATLLDNAIANVGGLTINQFNCSWRGNFLLEIGDKIELITKDNNSVFSYVLNDSITYNGGLAEATQWSYTDNDGETASNPTNLGEALKKTFARVDKANKQIDIVASETAANSAAISALQINTESINASVEKVEKASAEALEAVNENISTLTQKVEAQVTAEQVTLEIKKELANGSTKVETSTGFTFNEEGLNVSKSGSEMATKITEDGMTVTKNNEKVLQANNEGVKAIDLHAKTYLIVGTNSRFENYGSDRTGCFWIGG